MRFLVTKRMRKRVRSVARERYMGFGSTVAIEGMEEAIREEFSNPIYVFLIDFLVKLAVELILHWLNEGVGSPDLEYQEGEPGF